MTRYAFYISDSTGITSETLGNALLPLFKETTFRKVHLPYTDSMEKAEVAVEQINQAHEASGLKPLIFDTIMNPDIRDKIASSNGFLMDIIGTFLPALEKELGAVSSYKVGQSHDNPAEDRALRRMNAVNYALDNDDGAKTKYYKDADVILVGVSRSAKTPTCLYIAMQFGIFAANYPLTEEDLNKGTLPKSLLPYKNKLFALTIAPKRLSCIRQERRADSRYASLKQCEWETKEAEFLYRKWGIPMINTTSISVEEITTHIIVSKNLQRRV
ncbi:pyruvate, water dikinase regulatory protein [Marinibactrum halimedae]|uniref:posphoenolpyruvate synthetase regulatory kinase/phosphorylase PpsR n=1 Tax=Marinibactrum halimedae TaxID=1444977 RepID=UPI002FCCBB84